jgi:CBS-domain-containing membrane protein
LVARLGKQLRQPSQWISARLQARRTQVASLACIRCAAEMRIERLSVYGPGGPVALMLAGVVVLGLGFLAWPLFLLSPVAVGLGVFYRRRGPTRWHCRSCGYIIPREG